MNDGSAAGSAPVTVSDVFGQLTWLVGQSSRHASFRVSDLNWLLMPPIIARQFHIFREGSRPVGAALWANPTPAAEMRLEQGALSPANTLQPEDWSGGPNLWLVELIAPFTDSDNRQLEVMLGDLILGPFKGRPFRMLQIDPASGAMAPIKIGADVGQALVARLAVEVDKWRGR